MSDELCPFCGNSEELDIRYDRSEKFVICLVCYAKGPPSRERVKAFELWNTRAVPTPQPMPTVPKDIADIIDEALSDWMVHAVVDWENSSMSKAVLDDMTALKNMAQAWLDGLTKE